MEKEIKYLLVGLICLFLPLLFSDGMFMDGIIYSAVSNNLANGYGSVFSPMYTETFTPLFNGHPPVSFWIESLFFKVFGSEFWIERLYMLTILILNLTALFKIFKEIKRSELFIYAAALFIFTPLSIWSFQNNTLECTMLLFSLWSIYFSLLVINQKINAVIGCLIMSFLLIFSFGSKGFPGLFPLSVFFLFSMTSNTYKIKSAGFHSFILFLFIGIITLFFSFQEDLNFLIRDYMEIQVLTSLRGESYVSLVGPLSNFLSFIAEMGILLLIVIISVVIKKIKRLNLYENNKDKRLSIFFLMVALSASLPLLVSPKLRTFYFLPSLPFFIISGVLFLPTFTLSNKIKRVIIGTGITFSIIGVSLTTIFWGKPKRDFQLLEDISAIAEVTNNNKIIACDYTMSGNYSVIGYFMRYHFISLKPEGKGSKTDKKLHYYIALSDSPVNGYHAISTDAKTLFLFERNE